METTKRRKKPVRMISETPFGKRPNPAHAKAYRRKNKEFGEPGSHATKGGRKNKKKGKDRELPVGRQKDRDTGGKY